MFVDNRLEEDKLPILGWLDESDYREDKKLVKQVEDLADLDFLHFHVALMADAHLGMGMPIGGVIATKGVVVPAAVGNDIACGVSLIKTNVNMEEIENDISNLSGQIMRSIPLGFKRRKKLYENDTSYEFMEKRNNFIEEFKDKYDGMDSGIERELLEIVPIQLGTLGGGNHFIETIKFEDNNIGFMVHSGSRHLGAAIASRFIGIAKELNNDFNLDYGKLAYLPVNSNFFDFGDKYIDYMNFCKEFAKYNRRVMLDICFKELKRKTGNAEETYYLNTHHNYANLENHYNRNVLIHRKGAVLARKGMEAIIPSAMGCNSYIVVGKGNRESFHSVSHGAGRRMSRTEAKDTFTVQEMIEELKERNVKLFAPDKSEVLDEYRKAYKSIKDVLDKQRDLVEIKEEVKPLSVIKG